MSKLTDQIATLFGETGRAHHDAFAAVSGEDPEWPTWYADYLDDKLPTLLVNHPTKSELVDVLILLSKEHPAKAPHEDWAQYYARYMVEHYP